MNNNYYVFLKLNGYEIKDFSNFFHNEISARIYKTYLHYHWIPVTLAESVYVFVMFEDLESALSYKDFVSQVFANKDYKLSKVSIATKQDLNEWINDDSDDENSEKEEKLSVPEPPRPPKQINLHPSVFFRELRNPEDLK